MINDSIKNKLEKYGLSGINKPKRDTHNGKSHIVLAKD
jgi:hypothetical protein